MSSLAWAELYLVLATLVSRFDFELFDVVKERDIDYAGDFFLGIIITQKAVTCLRHLLTLSPSVFRRCKSGQPGS